MDVRARISGRALSCDLECKEVSVYTQPYICVLPWCTTREKACQVAEVMQYNIIGVATPPPYNYCCTPNIVIVVTLRIEFVLAIVSYIVHTHLPINMVQLYTSGECRILKRGSIFMPKMV